MTHTDARELFEYNDWASRRLLPAFEELSDEEWTAELGGSFGTPQSTLAHLVAAEWLWLERWRGTSPTSLPDWVEGSSADLLLARLARVAEARRAWLADLTDQALDQEIEYSFLSGDRHRSRLAVLLRHLVNHSTYHRGQLVTMLRQLGRTPEATDLLWWDLGRHPVAPESATQSGEGGD